MLLQATIPTQFPTDRLVFSSNSGRDYLSLPARSLLWVQAQKNYVEFCWQDEHEVYTTQLRITFKAVQAQLPDSFIQTHRSFMIQPHHIEQFSARHVGYTVKLGRSTYPVPVSRNHGHAVINYLRNNLPHLRP